MPLPRNRKDASGGMSLINHEDCWGKTTADNQPGISVRDHCLNVGCVAEALWVMLPPHLRVLLPPGTATLAALHDIGKVSPGFQQKCPAWLVKHHIQPGSAFGNEADHAKISQFTLQKIVADSFRLWAAVIGAHHGNIKGDRIAYISEDNHVGWEAERLRLVRELMVAFGPLPSELGNEAAWWMTAGLITVADWIGSDEEMFPQTWTDSLDSRRQRARAALLAIPWEPPKAKIGFSFTDLFPGYQANEIQSATMEKITEPGLYIIEGPMGCGKTEAALSAAYRIISSGKATGIYFALPTQITSNRIHLRVESFLNQVIQQASDLYLIHSGSWLIHPAPLHQLRSSKPGDAEADEHIRAGRSWFTSAKRAILAPFGVGTVDQALLGIVAAKHFFVRQLGLAGKVVILDEVHTYDLYTSTLIDKLIERLLELRCTVIVLSATLTRDRRRQLLAVAGCQATDLSAAYPLLSCVSSSLREFPIEPPPPKPVAVRFPAAEALAESCLERAHDGECVLWIRNTVDEAQETFGQLKSANHEGGPEIALLHSRFPQFRREELENDWMERLGKDGTRRPQNGCVLVSTQVAEQSVDIDADLLITDLSPTDMLLQRIGRLWRHERPRPCGRAEVWIRPITLTDEQLGFASAKELQLALGKSARVYAPYVLLRSWQQWQHRKMITLPGDIRAILEATYTEPGAGEPPAWRELREDLERKKVVLSAKAINATKVWFQPSLADEEGVQTRFSAYPTASLLVARIIETLDAVSTRLTLLNGDTATVSERNWNIEAARALHRNLVPMPRWVVRAALGTAPGWLRLHIAQATAIGLLQPDSTIVYWRSDIESGLSYCPERGILISRTKQPTTTALENWDEDESYD
jgi:CRISPR-associated endonuclease/helicase Cas3